ncbi:MAG: hypothetical protein DME26_20035 [Verrucomicrobia bacterium]|nr:MAG: hypothetical protein DME26_20035 [Verrucomicrobiota bacterium]
MVGSFLFLLASGSGLFLYDHFALRPERAQVKARYVAMHRALQTRDVETVRSLLAPSLRPRAAKGDFGILPTFVTAFGKQSAIHISGSKATVVPERVFYWGIIPGGNSIEMVKIDGQWFFTGKVHID